MDITNLVSPITSSHWDKTELSDHKCTLNGDLDLFSDLDSKTDVTVLISNGDNCLESGSLTGFGLLLDGDDLHHFIRKFFLALLDKFIYNFSFLDGD